MGIRKGTLSFSRYRLIGSLPDHFPHSSMNGSASMPFRPSGAPLTKRQPAGRGWKIPWIRIPVRLLCPGPLPALLASRRPEVGRAVPAQAQDHGGRARQTHRNRPEETLPGTTGGNPGGDAPRTSRKVLADPLLLRNLLVRIEQCAVLLFALDKVFEELQELFRDSFQLSLCSFVPGIRNRRMACPPRGR